MYKLIAISLFAGILFVSCGKKTQTTTTKNPGDNKTQETKQQTRTQKESPSMIDFDWKENGKDHKLSDYKGKVIVLNFWATWCGPCKREIPDLSQLSSELKNKDFKLIGVSVDDNRDDLNKFVKAYKIEYTVVHKPDGLVTQYMDITGQRQNVVPQTYIIDKNGKVVETILGARSKSDFLSLINKYL